MHYFKGNGIYRMIYVINSMGSMMRKKPSSMKEGETLTEFKF
jgi:hypothetical protein